MKSAACNIDSYDGTVALKETRNFNGVNFLELLEQKKNIKNYASVREIANGFSDARARRQRKSRLVLVEGNGSGYGSKMVPVLSANNYDLLDGESSVFDRELGNRGDASRKAAAEPPKKLQKQRTFINQDHCQHCSDGGALICCDKCPVSVHVDCYKACSGGEVREGLGKTWSCMHHYCINCWGSASTVGGLLYRCEVCPYAWCDSCLPATAIHTYRNFKYENELNYKDKHASYIHCSPDCRKRAVQFFGWKPPKSMKRRRCPIPLELESYFTELTVGDDVVEDVTTSSVVERASRRARSEVKSYAGNDVEEDADGEYLPDSSPGSVKSEKNGPTTAQAPGSAPPQPRVGGSAATAVTPSLALKASAAALLPPGSTPSQVQKDLAGVPLPSGSSQPQLQKATNEIRRVSPTGFVKETGSAGSDDACNLTQSLRYSSMLPSMLRNIADHNNPGSLA